jgi:hypothetical protein
MSIETVLTRPSTPGAKRFSSGPGADLSDRVAALRAESFDLERDVRTASRIRDSRELEAAADQMQSIANRMGAVEELLLTTTEVASPVRGTVESSQAA